MQRATTYNTDAAPTPFSYGIGQPSGHAAANVNLPKAQGFVPISPSVAKAFGDTSTWIDPTQLVEEDNPPPQQQQPPRQSTHRPSQNPGQNPQAMQQAPRQSSMQGVQRQSTLNSNPQPQQPPPQQQFQRPQSQQIQQQQYPPQQFQQQQFQQPPQYQQPQFQQQVPTTTTAWFNPAELCFDQVENYFCMKYSFLISYLSRLLLYLLLNLNINLLKCKCILNRFFVIKRIKIIMLILMS
jgi:hypothetical protein